MIDKLRLFVTRKYNADEYSPSEYHKLMDFIDEFEKFANESNKEKGGSE